jgi:hypothetical protein
MRAAGCLNGLWMLKSLPEAAAFRQATRRLAQTQETILLQTLRRNRDTLYGGTHNFSTIADARQYQSRVPLVRHQDIAPALERIARGESQVLTGERVETLYGEGNYDAALHAASPRA